MNNDVDIEGILKRHRSGPGEAVKRSVMARFSSSFRPGSRGGGPAGFWKKSVPLYLYAATVLLAVGMSFLAGIRTNPARRHVDLTGEQPRAESVMEGAELEREIAPNDVL